MNYLIYFAATEAAATSAIKITTPKKHIESP